MQIWMLKIDFGVVQFEAIFLVYEPQLAHGISIHILGPCTRSSNQNVTRESWVAFHECFKLNVEWYNIAVSAIVLHFEFICIFVDCLNHIPFYFFSENKIGIRMAKLMPNC